MATFRERISGPEDGEGTEVLPTGKPEITKHHLAVKRGEKFDRAKAEKLAGELFDAIATQRAKAARAEDE